MKMRLVFLSNFYNHHQRPLSCAFERLTGHSFAFVATEKFSEERRLMGWDPDEDAPFVIHCDGAPAGDAAELVNDADVVIYGNAPPGAVKERLRAGKPVFRYSERLFKHGYDRRKRLPRVIKYYFLYDRHRSLYLLSAGAFAAADYQKYGAFREKSYKWGYFPEAKTYDIGELMSAKRKNSVLWCGRFLDWKHPEAAVEVAKRLKSDGYSFSLEIIGSGEKGQMLEESIKKYALENEVKLLGAMTPDEVRAHMEAAEIFLFTSDRGEGWGAVLNESMNSGCAVVASHAAGAVPYLVKHGENGIVYRSGDTDGLYSAVRSLMDAPDRRRSLGERAYCTIRDTWNADVAAERFLKLADELRAHGRCDLYPDGPCSAAEPFDDDWFTG